MRTTAVSVAIALAFAVAACGETSDQPSAVSSDNSEAEALEERIEQLESEAEERDAEAARKVAAAKKKEREARRKARAARRQAKRRKAEAEKRAEAAAPASTGGGLVVPDVVGLDHQAAQDAMQGEGLWSLDEKDCTGQGRILLWDRNWEVVSTDPPAGTPVTEDTTITLCSKQQGE